MSGLLIIIVLFALLWFVLIRPQRARAQAQQRSAERRSTSGDEILTVGGIYGIVQELEPEEEGGDLVVEIAEGIHVRVSRKGLAMVVKPDEDEDEEDEDDGRGRDGRDGGRRRCGEPRFPSQTAPSA